MSDISLNIFHVLLVIMPGFFFLKGCGYRKNFDFEYTIFSTFWGIILDSLFLKFIPLETLQPALDNPYTGAIVFSILSFMLGAAIKFLTMLPRTSWHW